MSQKEPLRHPILQDHRPNQVWGSDGSGRTLNPYAQEQDTVSAIETEPLNWSLRFGQRTDQANSRPRIDPVEEANLSVSRPMRWSIETKRFGRG